MPHEPLKGERIAAAVHQIFPGEGVPERMDGSPFHAPGVVVLHDGEPQSIFCQEAAELIAEKIVRYLALTHCHVVPKDGNHGRTEGDDLNLAVLCVPEYNLPPGQVYILDQNVSHRSSPATAVEQEIDDDPIPILTEVAVGFRLLQEGQEFFICVNLLHRLRCLVQFDVQFCVSFLVAPGEEDLEGACVTVDRTCRQPFLTHGQDRLVKIGRVQAVHRNGYIQPLGDGLEVLPVSV